MVIDETADQKVTTAVEEVTKKLRETNFSPMDKSEDQNNRIDKISAALLKLKITLQEVTLLSDRIQTLEPFMQALRKRSYSARGI